MAVSFYSMMGNAGCEPHPYCAGPLSQPPRAWRSAIAVCALPAALLLPLVGIRFPNGAAQHVTANTTSGPSASRRTRVRTLTALVLGNRSVVLLAIIYALAGMGDRRRYGLSVAAGCGAFCPEHRRSWDRHRPLLWRGRDRQTVHGLSL